MRVSFIHPKGSGRPDNYTFSWPTRDDNCYIPEHELFGQDVLLQ